MNTLKKKRDKLSKSVKIIRWTVSVQLYVILLGFNFKPLKNYLYGCYSLFSYIRTYLIIARISYDMSYKT